MKQTLTASDCIAILEGMARDIEAAQDYLTNLDSALGDGDHGISMTIGFRTLRDKLPGVADKDIGTILKTAGMALVSSIGGAAGPLFGTAFMRAGMAIGAKMECTLADVIAANEAAVKGIMERGGCKIGDKTILDVLYPVTESLKSSLSDGQELIPALETALIKAKEALEATRGMVCRRGRSSRFGERTIGHLDPGAASATVLMESMVKTVRNRMEGGL